MKNTMLQISIPQPCHEDWQAMTPATKGRFCDKCMKNVVDFTTKNDREILEAYTKDAKLCGRFRNDQLDRNIVVVEKKSTVWLATTSAIMTLVGVESSEVLAQEKPKTEQHENFMLSKMIAPVKPQTKVIKGVVSDNVGPIPGANVVIKGTKTSTQTDMDGKFSIEAKENDVIVVSFLGLTTIEQKVDENNFYKIELKQSENHVTLGVVIVCKKRTFFGRIFHSIGNWFR
ncbi:hypothetical protein B0A58_14755 [Flavobacterium branchiophilum NBRC 15030 = ATCC 35035]|uniref:Carboxypeptidase-like protein n=1 Tax=Flavobacterium branchiophilum TaxID=55197 RepID=A0A543G8F5_9FLAO|nr:carboxypeptidase-like regulatory domain-containing protein [Flavobacterium branchiophilum]OXA70221.1 hypothetical protein B0A58_14755 [Flavobacterium branchiophilum NBRC 15030 = ATCC 35035]TQM42362.1 carboxypeptidase-like protein [Flavobacterium branchiophilum]